MSKLVHMINKVQAELEAMRTDTSVIREHLGNLPFQQFWHSPIPAWIKGVRPCEDNRDCLCTAMLAINPAYSAKFGVALRTYLDNPDSAVWQAGNNFDELDHQVYRERKSIVGYERGTTMDGRPVGGRSYKWPMYDDEGRVVAVGGQAVDWRPHNPLWQRFCEAQLRLENTPEHIGAWERLN